MLGTRLWPLLAVVAFALAGNQVGTQPLAGSYQFIETPQVGFGSAFKEALAPGAGQIGKVRDRLVTAGEQGYAVRFFARRALSLSMLLKRESSSPHAYRVVMVNMHKPWLKAVNDAAAEGFRLVPDGAKLFNRYQERFKEQWVAVLERQSAETRVTYSMVRGKDEDAERQLADARNRGATLVASFGHPHFDRLVLLLEEPQSQTAAARAPQVRQYRIVSTDLTSTLETEVRNLAAQGYRAVAAGAMAVLMERDGGESALGAEYRLLAARQRETLQKELSAAGAEGFRLVVVPDHPNETVLLLERTPGATGLLAYSIVPLSTQAAMTDLARAENDGYRVVALIDDEAILERGAN